MKRRAEELRDEDFDESEDEEEFLSDTEDFDCEYDDGNDYVEECAEKIGEKAAVNEDEIATDSNIDALIIDAPVSAEVMAVARMQLLTWNQKSQKSNSRTLEDPPIVRAAASGSRNLVRAFLKLGCSIESATSYDYELPKFHYTKTYTAKKDTPLNAAIRKNNFSMFEFLLEMGASPGPLIEPRVGFDDDDPPPLWVATLQKNKEMISHLHKQIFLKTKKYTEEVYDAVTECREPLSLFILTSIVVMQDSKISSDDRDSLPDIVADKARRAVETYKRFRESSSYQFIQSLLQLAKQYEEGIGTDVDKNECALWYARYLEVRLLNDLQNTAGGFYIDRELLFEKIKSFAENDGYSNALAALPSLENIYRQYLNHKTVVLEAREALRLKKNEEYRQAYEVDMEIYRERLADYTDKRNTEIRRCLAANRGRRASSGECSETRDHDIDKCTYDHHTDLPPRCRWICTFALLRNPSGCKMGEACWFNHLSATKPLEPYQKRS